MIYQSFIDSFFDGKVLILVGPRQTGKTTFINKILDNQHLLNKTIQFNGDYFEDRELLNSQSLKKIMPYIEDKQVVFIDEGQKIEHIGVMLKIIADYYQGAKQIVITGSSSLHILDKTEEPLTGRNIGFWAIPRVVERDRL
jgi:predicted AAA+ superfamily ATPase